MQEEQPSSDTNWQFNPEVKPGVSITQATSPEVTWTASEFIGHEKSLAWYVMLGVVATIVAGGIFVLTHDYASSIMVIIITVAAAVFSSRKPRTLTYKLDDHGLVVGDKGYPYNKFKSFSLVEEDAVKSIYLLPLQRFMPPVSVYFPPDQEQQVLNVIGSYLPKEPRGLDAIERLMRRIHF